VRRPLCPEKKASHLGAPLLHTSGSGSGLHRRRWSLPSTGLGQYNGSSRIQFTTITTCQRCSRISTSRGRSTGAKTDYHGTFGCSNFCLTFPSLWLLKALRSTWQLARSIREGSSRSQMWERTFVGWTAFFTQFFVCGAQAKPSSIATIDRSTSAMQLHL
jgi:hypothetical protein